jgi:hypothetical protein
VNALVGGLLVVVPIYLAVLLLLKAMQRVGAAIRRVAPGTAPRRIRPLAASHVDCLLFYRRRIEGMKYRLCDT